MMYHEKFSNGLKFLFIEDEQENIDRLDLYILIKSGSVFEADEQRGISHLIEHLLFSRRGDFTKQQSVLDFLKALDVDFDARIIKEYTAYFFSFPRSKIKEFFKFLEDFFKPNFSQEELDKEKPVIIEEIEVMMKRNPDEFFSVLLDKTIWGQHPLAPNYWGDKNQIKDLSIKSIQNSFEKFYQPKNMVFAFSGNKCHLERLRKLCSELELLAGSADDLELSIFKDELREQKIIKVTDQRFTTTRIAFAFVYPRINSDEQIKFSMVGDLLEAKLFEKIREKDRLLYTVSTDFYTYVGSNVSLLECYFEYHNSNLQKLLKSVNEVVSAADITERDFENERKTFIRSLRETSASDILEYCSSQYLYNRKILPPEMAKKMIKESNYKDFLKFYQDKVSRKKPIIFIGQPKR